MENAASEAIDAQALMLRIGDQITRVVKAQDEIITRVVCAFASSGHVLLDDVPGTGKTTLAKALAASIAARFQRVQFTPDLLPADILGVSVFNQAELSFEFHEGPVFTEVLLADEVNRASPRTQAALLEAMAENQVSLDGEQRALPPLFFVIATQNPTEFQGTYPLPESQMDRFAMRLSMGFVSPEDEVGILSAQQGRLHPLAALAPIATPEDIWCLREAVARVRVSEAIKRYIVDLVNATRGARGVVHGASPRASLALMKSAQALALHEGYEFVTPDHVQSLAVEVIAHRLVINPQARHAGADGVSVVRDVLAEVKVPV
jgi:MoxR-like ATPase